VKNRKVFQPAQLALIISKGSAASAAKPGKKTGYTKNDCVSVCENTTCIRADFSPKHNDMLRIILKVTGDYNSLAVFSLAGFYV